MLRHLIVLPLVVVLLAGCGSAPPPSPSPAEARGPRELVTSSEPLPRGEYTRAGFRPSITFTLDDGWYSGSLNDGFVDVQQDRGTPDVIAVQFAVVNAVVGADGATVDAASAAVAAAAIAANPGLELLGKSESRMSRLIGANLEVENAGDVHAGMLDVSLGRLGIDSGRRLWISLFDTPDGVLAIMVGGSVAQWDRALAVAEPVLESVVIGPRD